jgi:ABC-type multidrug transport system ATPase subunit
MEQLEMVGLKDRARSKVHTYSQGMRQRLGIAIALVHNPQLIILDEPVNGLDPQGIADVRNLILHLSRHLGKTVLVSSHLLNEMEMIANRMLIIDKGRKVTEGTVAELFDPAKIIVAIEVNNPDHTLTWIRGSQWNQHLHSTPSASEPLKISLQMDKQEVPALAAGLVAAGASIVSIEPQYSLENYFLSLTTANRHVDTFTN